MHQGVGAGRWGSPRLKQAGGVGQAAMLQVSAKHSFCCGVQWSAVIAAQRSESCIAVTDSQARWCVLALQGSLRAAQSSTYVCNAEQASGSGLSERHT